MKISKMLEENILIHPNYGRGELIRIHEGDSNDWLEIKWDSQEHIMVCGLLTLLNCSIEMK